MCQPSRTTYCCVHYLGSPHVRSQSSRSGLGSGVSAGNTARTHAGCTLSSRVVPGPDTKIDTCRHHVKFAEGTVQAVIRCAERLSLCLGRTWMNSPGKRLALVLSKTTINVRRAVASPAGIFRTPTANVRVSLRLRGLKTADCTSHQALSIIQRRLSLENEALSDLPRCQPYSRSSAANCSLALIYMK